jgi:EmrB/QacA subfamily drug resistance transporter
MIAVKFPCDEAVILSGECASEERIQGRWVLVATILGSSLAFIDGTVVNVALPALQSALHATVSQVQWVMESYALLLSSLLLLGGSLGDLYGRAKVFVIGVILFACASVWCGLAPSIGWLIVARGLQGIGAALLVPGSLALISASFPDDRRGQAIGTWSGFTSITSALGPVLGGWLVEHASWRWVFFVNIPIAVAVVFITLLRVPESRDQKANRKLDWQGATVVTASLGAITFSLIEASRGGWSIRLPALLGAVGLCLFVLMEARSSSPMVDLGLFRSRNFTVANLLTFFLYAALGGILFFFPLDLIQVQHYSATEAGAALLPFIILMFVLSSWSGGLVGRFGPKKPLTIGPLVAAVGFALFIVADRGGTYWTTFFPATTVLGLGMAISVAPLTTTVMNAVPRDEAGTASGINNAVSRVAGLIAVAAFGLVLTAGFNRGLDRRLDALALPAAARQLVDGQRPKLAAAKSDDPRIQKAIADSFLSGYRNILFAAVGLALASGLCAMALTNNKKFKMTKVPQVS